HAIARTVPALEPLIIHAGVRVSEEVGTNQKTTRETVVIGTACRLIPLKGLVFLVRAMALLCKEFPHLRLTIAGYGPERSTLEAEVAKLGLASRTQFLGWKQDINSIFQNWDIFVMPSLEEGFGMAVIEAMSQGLPVIATSVGGLPEIVEDSRTGYLVPPS